MATTVMKGFEDLLDRLALTDDQRSTASTRVTGIRDFCDFRFKMDARAFTIGSYARGTLVRWERDIDMLAPLSAAEYWRRYKSSSRDCLYWFRNALNDEYPRTKVSSREVAAVLDFTVIRCEVVPAFILPGGGYVIPDGKGGWQATNPPYHQKLIKDADELHGGKLKPLVKLMKAWKIANKLAASSLHVELLTAEMWRGNTMDSHPYNVAATLKVMPSWLRSSRPDPWQPTKFVDSQLSSEDRTLAVKTAERDAQTSADAETARAESRTQDAFTHWNKVYRKEFPAYG
jgi:predicted nucleotidyltransferase